MESSFKNWGLSKDFSDPIYNYLIHGLSPGGFFTALLANDCITALGKSHPSNTLEVLKCIGGWVANYMPAEAWGNYEKIESWLKLSEGQRRKILEDCGLLLTEQQETWATLKDDYILDKAL